MVFWTYFVVRSSILGTISGYPFLDFKNYLILCNGGLHFVLSLKPFFDILGPIWGFPHVVSNSTFSHDNLRIMSWYYTFVF